MSAGQIILYLFIALTAYLVLKKFWLLKTIKHYSPSELSKKLKNTREVILVDVRTSDERKAQSIKNSLHIPLAEITARMDELKKYKGKEIICYCRTGNRSLSAASKLKKNDFNVANLKGGILQWKAEGLR
jgi:rhodanese-related sulfurtransferase